MFQKYKYTLASLILASLLSVAMVGLRVYRTGFHTYYFLIWNLFLALVPLVFSFAAERVFWRTGKLSIWVLLLGLGWLLFYPNAPYIVTDLIHLKARTEIALWFDILLILSFVWTGIFAGFVSLYLMQRIVTKVTNKWGGWIFVFVVIGLGSFGVYLGRFLRWNSWDVLYSPTHVAADVLVRVLTPLSHRGSVVFTIVFSAFSIFMYLLLYAFSHLHAEWEKK